MNEIAAVSISNPHHLLNAAGQHIRHWSYPRRVTRRKLLRPGQRHRARGFETARLVARKNDRGWSQAQAMDPSVWARCGDMIRTRRKRISSRSNCTKGLCAQERKWRVNLRNVLLFYKMGGSQLDMRMFRKPKRTTTAKSYNV